MHKIKLFALILTTLFFVAGCKQKKSDSVMPQGPKEPQVQIDISTPDKALKSYWNVRDQVRRAQRELLKNQLAANKGLESGLSAVTTDSIVLDFQISISEPEQFVREISEVKVESESRAVVLAVIKNTTPIPTGAEVNKYDEERRRDGERYKYVLEKDAKGWRVGEIWTWETYPNAHWKKMYPQDNRKITPSLTYEGL